MSLETFVKVKRLHPEAKLPTKATTGSVCHDVYASESRMVGSGAVVPVPTGLAFEVPDGCMLEIRPRSGLSSEGLAIANSPGTLDSDYRGELMILMLRAVSPSDSMWLIDVGDRIAQIKLVRVPEIEFLEVDELSETVRGEGGFGSTGR